MNIPCLVKHCGYLCNNNDTEFCYWHKTREPLWNDYTNDYANCACNHSDLGYVPYDSIHGEKEYLRYIYPLNHIYSGNSKRKELKAIKHWVKYWQKFYPYSERYIMKTSGEMLEAVKGKQRD